jgi:hypothetical protein
LDLAHILLYAVNRISDIGRTYIADCGQIAAITAAYEVHKTLNRILADTHEIDRSIKD